MSFSQGRSLGWRGGATSRGLSCQGRDCLVKRNRCGGSQTRGSFPPFTGTRNIRSTTSPCQLSVSVNSTLWMVYPGESKVFSPPFVFIFLSFLSLIFSFLVTTRYGSQLRPT